MSYGKPEITDTHIKCDVCHQWYKKLTHAHLFKMHSLTIDQYKEKFGLVRAQPLEAFYIKGLRQKYNKKYGATKYLVKDFCFEKGHKGRTDKRRWQEIHRLKKLNDRIKGKILVLMPAEVVCIFDLYRRLQYPIDRIAKVMHLSTNYVRDLLATKEKLYRRWRTYYIRKGTKHVE
jgi:hypothetical protein